MVDCPPSVLAPGASQDVNISFSPSEAGLFRAVVPFKINGLYTVKIVILGEGSPLRLELANAAHTNLNLGAVSRGGQTSKTVQVRPHHTNSCAAAYLPGHKTHIRCCHLYSSDLFKCVCTWLRHAWLPTLGACKAWLHV